ncbi:LRRC7 protein, partial [Pandion haliaetus]|nr:LRRC7 protein [Pandion haliaetus]
VCCLEMTTKRKIIGRLVPCRCFRGEEEIVSVLDYSHCGLQQVPKEVFNFERTLEELYLDANQIEELPKVISVLPFFCVYNNSFNIFLGIQDFPENIKCCKCLTIIEASVNPVSK